MAQRCQKGGCPGAAVSGSCKPPGVGTGNLTQVLWKGRTEPTFSMSTYQPCIKFYLGCPRLKKNVYLKSKFHKVSCAHLARMSPPFLLLCPLICHSNLDRVTRLPGTFATLLRLLPLSTEPTPLEASGGQWFSDALPGRGYYC